MQVTAFLLAVIPSSAAFGALLSVVVNAIERRTSKCTDSQCE